MNLSEQLSKKKMDVYHIRIICMSLKVIAPNLLAAVGVRNVNPRN